MTTSVTTRAAGTRNPTRQQLDELDALLQRMLDLPVHPLDEPEPAESEEAVEEPPPLPLLPKRQRERIKEEIETPVSPPPSYTVPVVKPPISYMVVETASPRPLPRASGFEPRPSALPPQPAPRTSVDETPILPGQISETPFAAPLLETDEEETWVPLRSTWKPSAQTWPPLAESWHQANSGATPFAPPPASQQNPLPDNMPVEETRIPAAGAADSPRLPTPIEDHPAADVADSPIAPAAEPRLSLSAEDAPNAVPWPWLPLMWFNQGFDACFAPLGAPGRWLCGPGRHLFGLIGLACLAAAVIIALSTGMGWTW